MKRQISDKYLIEVQFQHLRRLIENLFYNNPNFVTGYFDKEYKTIWEFRQHELKEKTEYVTEKLDELRDLMLDLVEKEQHDEVL